MADWYAGLDLGQQGDFTALALLGRVELPKGEPRIVRTERPVEIPEELQRMSKMGPVERAMKGLDNTEYQAVFGVAPPWPTVVEERTVQDDGRTELHVRHVQRWPLGTSYPAIVARVREILDTPQLRGRTTLVLDATGVGRP